MHIAAIFIVLIAASLGAAIPIFMKYHPGFNLDPFYIICGKCFGIGLILACGLVHMLQPASQSLVSPCLPYEFNTDYPAYAFMYCMLSIFIMHFIDFVVEYYIVYVYLPKKEGKSNSSPEVEMKRVEGGETKNKEDTKVDVDEEKKSKILEEIKSHGHVHSILLVEDLQRTAAAYLLEIGVASHSIFIGLTVGISEGSELNTLLVALCFHQLFEGIALGSRIADANMSHYHEVVLSFVFAITAPIGLAVGVGLTAALNPAGETYLMFEGTFDSFCAGILIYLAINLLLRDFREDMEKYCGKNLIKRGIMFAFLYLGGGIFAYLGKYL